MCNVCNVLFDSMYLCVVHHCTLDALLLVMCMSS